MKKLLKKVEDEAADNETNLEEFQRRLREIARRYKLDNDALINDITNLHRDLTQ